MIIYIDLLLNKLLKYRQSLGLSFFFFGAPIIYFLRDGLKLAPNSTAFTAVLTIGSLLLAFPLTIKKLYQTNTLGYLLCIAYSIIAIFYLATYAPNRGWFTNTTVEAVYQALILLSMFIFAGTSINTLKNNFLLFSLIICLIGGLSLLYYILRNPLYVIGMRASISFGGDDAVSSMGNPHIYAKSAYCGVVAGIILLKDEKRLLWRLFYIGSVLLLLLVVALCQAMAIILITGLFFFFYYLTNINAHNIYKGLKWVFGWQGILLFFLACGGIYYLWEHTRFNEYFINVSSIITDRIERIVTSLTDTKTASTVKLAGDDSASTRVTNITNLFKSINERLEDGDWLTVIFGNGYHHKYIDSPIFQTLNDLGIIGFVVFTLIHIILLIWVFKEIFNPTCNFTLFTAYVFLVTVIQNFTMGMPYDYQRWTAIIFVARFALNYKRVPVIKAPKAALTT
ncbi:hypothetical protein [Emticicia agri]|uniref:O-antigen ligase domain-containing protein n=1 Tax=Emticicia agri TaxID=2492393 RepID=A0A4Q5M286_9BACT|nr:hypothetical protein [Emticicia agri]RYU96129.1 hypothetical protein EWM59_07925 [Emticicia agri]